MTRFVPYPLLGLFLYFLWLVLGEAYSPGQILLGALIAIGGTWTMTILQFEESRLRRPMATLRLAISVSADIIRSNIAVGRIISRRKTPATSGFLIIPLELKNPNGLAILSCILTAIPGTVWVSYDSNARTLLLHILDLIDEDSWVRLIKDRYERLLIEVLE